MVAFRHWRNSIREYILWKLDGGLDYLLSINWLRSILQHLALVLAWLWGLYVFRIRNKVKIVGRENLPHDTSVVYGSNHQTLIDSFLIGIAVMTFWEVLFYPKRIPWNAPDRVNYLERRFFRHVFRLLKNIPVDRKTTNVSVIKKTFSRFCSALKQSNLVLFFEGGRSRNGEIGQCVPGVSAAIHQAKPKYVVPILLHRIQPIMPIEAGFSWSGIARGKKGTIVIGKPIDLSALIEQTPLTHELKQQIGELVRQSVIDLQIHLPST